jgi:hypothetical protein
MPTNAALKGRPLAEALDKKDRDAIREMWKSEQKALARNLRIGRSASRRAKDRLRRGKPRGGYSLILLEQLQPLLKNDTLSQLEIGARSNVKISEVKRYQRITRISRTPGRRSEKLSREASRP